MPYIRVHVDADDVLEELDDEELTAELERRRVRKHKDAGDPENFGLMPDKTNSDLLEIIYLQQRDIGNPSPEMREYVYRELGRIL